MGRAKPKAGDIWCGPKGAVYLITRVDEPYGRLDGRVWLLTLKTRAVRVVGYWNVQKNYTRSSTMQKAVLLTILNDVAYERHELKIEKHRRDR